MITDNALLIIDIQRGYINKHTKKLPSLAESLQSKYELVYITRLEYAEHSPFLEIRKSSGFGDVERPTELAFQPATNAKIFLKHGYSALTDELRVELEQQGVQQIDLIGMDTDQCVLSTALGLFDAGITPRVLSGYCASTGGTGFHRAGIKILKRALGKHNVL